MPVDLFPTANLNPETQRLEGVVGVWPRLAEKGLTTIYLTSIQDSIINMHFYSVQLRVLLNKGNVAKGAFRLCWRELGFKTELCSPK